MSLNIKEAAASGGGNRPVLEVGTYPARVVQIIDLGLQNQRPYKGKDKPPAHEVMVTYELLDAFMLDEDGKEMEDKPRWISETFPLYNIRKDKAKSTKRYMALDPDMDYDGDFTQLTNTPCNVTIVHGEGKGPNAGKIYENIGSVTAMRAKDAKAAPALVNPTKVFTLDDPDLDVLTSMPDWLADKIKNNLEFKGSKLADLLGESGDEDSEEEQEEKEEW